MAFFGLEMSQYLTLLLLSLPPNLGRVIEQNEEGLRERKHSCQRLVGPLPQPPAKDLHDAACICLRQDYRVWGWGGAFSTDLLIAALPHSSMEEVCRDVCCCCHCCCTTQIIKHPSWQQSWTINSPSLGHFEFAVGHSHTGGNTI